MASLEYDEIVRLTVSSICPDSLGTISKQNEILEPQGITLVAFIKDTMFLKVFSELESLGYNFQRAPNPHLTMLGLFDSIKKLRSYDEQIRTEMAIVKFFQTGNTSINFKITFDQVRPGRAYDKGGNPRPMISDGTIYARADPCNNETFKFSNVTNALSLHLRNSLPDIFSSDLRSKYPTVWCTLGYFKNADFAITDDLKKKFEDMKEHQLFELLSENEIIVDKLHLVKYRDRRLVDYSVIRELS